MSKQPEIIYKVTKKRLERRYDFKTRTYGDYEVRRKQIDYRTRYGDVVLAINAAASNNAWADRNPEAAHTRYEVEVELAPMPVFQKLSDADPKRQVTELAEQVQWTRKMTFVPFNPA